MSRPSFPLVFACVAGVIGIGFVLFSNPDFRAKDTQAAAVMAQETTGTPEPSATITQVYSTPTTDPTKQAALTDAQIRKANAEADEAEARAEAARLDKEIAQAQAEAEIAKLEADKLAAENAVKQAELDGDANRTILIASAESQRIIAEQKARRDFILSMIIYTAAGLIGLFLLALAFVKWLWPQAIANRERAIGVDYYAGAVGREAAPTAYVWHDNNHAERERGKPEKPAFLTAEMERQIAAYVLETGKFHDDMRNGYVKITGGRKGQLSAVTTYYLDMGYIVEVTYPQFHYEPTGDGYSYFHKMAAAVLEIV